MYERIMKLKQMLESAGNVVILTGAGVSTDSGIPDFRSKNGLYEKKDPDFAEYKPEYLLSHECFVHEPKVFYRFYRKNLDCRNAVPGLFHKWAAALNTDIRHVTVITQNIDGLHEAAGSDTVLHVHGTAGTCHCTKCGQEFDGAKIFESNDAIPRCPNCKGIGFLKPNVVLYNEPLPAKALFEAYHAIDNADLLLVAGTSLTVHPVCDLPSEFHGESLVIMNNQTTPFDNWANLVFHEDLKDILTRLRKV